VEDVSSVAQDGEQQGRSQIVTVEERETHGWGGKHFDRHKGRLRLGQSFSEVGGGEERCSEPETEPPERSLWVENRPIEIDRDWEGCVPVHVGVPVAQFSFRDQEANSEVETLNF